MFYHCSWLTAGATLIRPLSDLYSLSFVDTLNAFFQTSETIMPRGFVRFTRILEVCFLCFEVQIRQFVKFIVFLFFTRVRSKKMFSGVIASMFPVVWCCPCTPPGDFLP